MADRLPTQFRNSSEPAVASYNFFDIFRGKGYVRFYPCSASDSSATEYLLSTNLVYSDDITISDNYTNTITFAKNIDQDFDITLERPVILEGDMICNIPSFNYHISGESPDYYLVIRLRKYDGTTETEVASNQTATRNTSTHPASHMYNIRVDIPRTKFEAGSTIRITFELWSRHPSSAGNDTFYIGVDPEGRTTTTSGGGTIFDTIPSTSTIDIPIVIEQ